METRATSGGERKKRKKSKQRRRNLSRERNFKEDLMKDEKDMDKEKGEELRRK